MNDKEEQTKQKYMELQIVMQQLKELNQQLEVVQHQFSETNKLGEYLDDLDKIKDKADIFAGVGPGIFVKAQLTETGKVLVNIGSNTAVYKTVNEAKKLVVQQSAEIKEVLDKITVEIQKLSERSQMIQKEVQGLVS